MASRGRFWWLPFGSVPEISARELYARLASGQRPQEAGFADVRQLEGGMRAWWKGGLPVVEGS